MNRPYPSYLKQSEAWWTAFQTKLSFISKVNENGMYTRFIFKKGHRKIRNGLQQSLGQLSSIHKGNKKLFMKAEGQDSHWQITLPHQSKEVGFCLRQHCIQDGLGSTQWGLLCLLVKLNAQNMVNSLLRRFIEHG